MPLAYADAFAAFISSFCFRLLRLLSLIISPRTFISLLLDFCNDYAFIFFRHAAISICFIYYAISSFIYAER